jgi:sulfur carrier protein
MTGPGDTSAISINGTPGEVRSGATVAELVTEWCPSKRGIAVARNGDIVPKSRWSSTRIAPGDQIEIVTAAAGG